MYARGGHERSGDVDRVTGVRARTTSPGSTSASGTWLIPSFEPSVGRTSLSGSSVTATAGTMRDAARSSGSPKYTGSDDSPVRRSSCSTLTDALWASAGRGRRYERYHIDAGRFFSCTLRSISARYGGMRPRRLAPALALPSCGLHVLRIPASIRVNWEPSHADLFATTQLASRVAAVRARHHLRSSSSVTSPLICASASAYPIQ